MKIGELSAYILSHYAELQRNYPHNCNLYEVGECINVLEMLKARLSKKYEDDDEYYTLSRDYSIDELREVLSFIYVRGTLSAFDCWIESSMIYS